MLPRTFRGVGLSVLRAAPVATARPEALSPSSAGASGKRCRDTASIRYAGVNPSLAEYEADA